MVYAQQSAEARVSSFGSEPLSPSLVKAAQDIYQTYTHIHGEVHSPLGVAIDRKTQRGHLIFSGQPILLPDESFIPLGQMKAFVEGVTDSTDDWA